ncbi:hypothetical protein [Thiospirillum jenense]|uniref:Uncharacterized protein n=1 Tax=Thiospirillum jenense TaxID=1653858 RepID=A0A839H874_9GAMM|nr:hypothetical protein [Thiospirillum jenense]MBB1125653.1 hypothetical protein [Thiospirillum jenense]
MDIKYNVEFVCPDNPRYIAWCAKNKKRYNKQSPKRDPHVAIYQLALRKWENVIRTLLSQLINEEKNRILRYSKYSSYSNYREIDFIGKLQSNSLMLCEIKLKEHYHTSLSAKQSGWAQLNKSISIAAHQFSDIGGLSICVDMSAIFTLKQLTDNDSQHQTYCHYQDIPSYFSLQPYTKNTLWLNSTEIADLAMQNDLLTGDEVNNLKKLFEVYKDPLSLLAGNQNNHVTNRPFMMLKHFNHK